VSSTVGAGEPRSLAQKLGLSKGLVVQELGWDVDADDDVRMMIEDAIDGELVEEAMEAVDVVLLWWRDDDGDLFDALSDVLATLADGGHVWLLTPKAGRDGHVEPSDIGEAAQTAGMSQTKSVSAAREWSGTLLVSPKARR
jgi:Protein of unknown function (DUF3052)